MSLTSTDLLKPVGLVDGAVFYPSLDSPGVAALINTYLTQGYTKASDAAVTDADVADDIARKFAYYRVWDDVVVRYYSTPTSVALGGELSVSFSGQQLSYWLAGRDQWERAFLDLIPDPVAPVELPPVSRAIPMSFRF